ncbi:MAG: DUF3566 domain-containing protein [Actinomycetaceae bacterium]|nr:DUF3566 domain-containing protein [Actinomycetaceae bacterium]
MKQSKKNKQEPAGDVQQVDPEGVIEDFEPRRVDLIVSRVDPWTVLKITFVLSFVLAIATVIAALLVWLLLNGLHVFADIRDFIGLIDDTGSIAQLVDYMKLPRVLALTAFVGVANVILLTAFTTIGAMIYNLSASLVGGIKVVLMDE